MTIDYVAYGACIVDLGTIHTLVVARPKQRYGMRITRTPGSIHDRGHAACLDAQDAASFNILRKTAVPPASVTAIVCKTPEHHLRKAPIGMCRSKI